MHVWLAYLPGQVLASFCLMVAFKIPFIQSKSLTKGYFDGIPSFRWCDVVDKDEIGKGSFGSVLKATYVPDNKTVVAKRFFGEGDSNLKNVAKEAKLLTFRKAFRFVSQSVSFRFVSQSTVSPYRSPRA